MNEIKNFIDTIFAPILTWLNMISLQIRNLSVPVSHPLDFNKYFGQFAFLGPKWMLVITTLCGLAFVYFIIFFIMNARGLYQKFKDSIQWW